MKLTEQKLREIIREELNSLNEKEVKHKNGEIIITPEDNSMARDVIISEVERLGIKADLNHIDLSKVKSFANLFSSHNVQGSTSFLARRFNGDISEWDVSHVVSMEYMFEASDFNGDISKWDVSNVVNMSHMFHGSKFNGNISKWRPGKNVNVMDIFGSEEDRTYKSLYKNLFKQMKKWDRSSIHYRNSKAFRDFKAGEKQR